jgi:trimeric autotransporter adhesin
VKVVRTRSYFVPIVAALIGLTMIPGARLAGQSGTAVGSVSATSLTFPAQGVDTASTPQVLTFTNTGDAALNIVSIVIAGTNYVDFSQTNTCGNSVAAGTNCALDITFEPQAFGTRTATLIITSSASNSPQTIALTGAGMAPALSLSSPALTFPGQLVTTNAEQTIRLTSSGDQPLAISSVVASGPFNENNTCVTSVLNPGQTCSIVVVFTPTVSGPVTGQLTIADNAFPPQQTVPLSGTGANFSLSLTPPSNSAAAGQSATYTVSVTSIDGFAGNVTLGCGGLPTGAACSFSPTMVSVSASGTASSTITISTTAPSTASRIPPGASRSGRPGGLRPGVWCWVLLALLAGIATWRRGSRMLLLGGAAGALLMLVLGIVACHPGGFPPVSFATPPDTYRLSVTGTTTTATSSVQNTVVLIIDVT